MKFKSIELFRILAMFGVIFLHVSSDTILAEKVGSIFDVFCVSFFYLVSIYFFFKKIDTVSLSDLNSKTINRLLKPYLIWSLIYTSALVFVGSKVKIGFISIFLYGQSAVQLYYIPTLIFIHYSIYAVFKLFFTKESRLINLLILAISFVYFLHGYQNEYFGVRRIGLLIGFTFLSLLAFTLKNKVNEVPKSFFLITGLLLSLMIIYLTWFNKEIFLIDFSFNYFLGGVGLFLIGIGWDIELSDDSYLLKVSSDVFKIYLCHVLFLELFERIVPNIHYDLPKKLLITAFLFIVSWIFIQITKKVKIHDRLF